MAGIVTTTHITSHRQNPEGKGGGDKQHWRIQNETCIYNSRLERIEYSGIRIDIASLPAQNDENSPVRPK